MAAKRHRDAAWSCVRITVSAKSQVLSSTFLCTRYFVHRTMSILQAQAVSADSVLYTRTARWAQRREDGALVPQRCEVNERNHLAGPAAACLIGAGG